MGGKLTLLKAQPTPEGIYEDIQGVFKKAFLIIILSVDRALRAALNRDSTAVRSKGDNLLLTSLTASRRSTH